MKKTVVIGASDNPERYAYKAVNMLTQHGHEVVAIGLRSGKINDIEINNQKIAVADVDTVTMYVGPQNQAAWYDYILSLKPNRIIFNPGTENPAFEKMAHEKGIETTEACTLVLLSTNQY